MDMHRDRGRNSEYSVPGEVPPPCNDFCLIHAAAIVTGWHRYCGRNRECDTRAKSSSSLEIFEWMCTVGEIVSSTSYDTSTKPPVSDFNQMRDVA